MQRSRSAPVCVIIAAKDAAATISRAVRSALEEQAVGEVLVIDDGSRDDTAGAARDCDDGSGRLRVLRFTENRGPSAARNTALACTRSPLIAILDADDFFLKGRFDRLVDGDDWDFVADNILFYDDRETPPAIPVFAPEPTLISLADFVSGNMTRRGRSRGELGFLKPVMRREFLERNGLTYDETLRLGEDYDLYVRALMRGARFRILRSCGYGAVIRSDSLSGRHATEDLRRLWAVDNRFLSSGDLPAQARRAFKGHAGQLRARYELRRFLDVKRESGAAAALRHAMTRPIALPGIAAGVFNDKRKAWFGGRDIAGDGKAAHMPRCLLPGRLVMGE